MIKITCEIVCMYVKGKNTTKNNSMYLCIKSIYIKLGLNTIYATKINKIHVYLLITITQIITKYASTSLSKYALSTKIDFCA